MKHLLALFAILLAGCAGTIVKDPATGAVTFNVSAGKLEVAAHADLLAAAAYATAHGYPARAAVWAAEDARLTAIETQISACANAIAASLPKPVSGPAPTPFLAIEIGAEAVGQFSGLPASVKINCAPFPIVTLPILPKLP